MRYIIFLLIGLSVSAPAFAVERAATLPPLIRAEFPDDKFKSKENRDALVKAARDYCNEVSTEFPRNSPSDEQWLNGEIQASASRLEKVMQSPQMSRRMAHNFVTDCLGFSEVYMKNENRAAGLVGMALAFSKFFPESESYARNSGINPEKFGFWSNRSHNDAFLRAALAELAGQ